MWGAGRGDVRCRQGAAAGWVALDLEGPKREFGISFLIYYHDDFGFYIQNIRKSLKAFKKGIGKTDLLLFQKKKKPLYCCI